LGGGFLTGKYREGNADSRATKLGVLVHAESNARQTTLLDNLLAVANELGVSPTHVAIAWLRDKAKHSTTALIPILGSRTREQLDATLGALNLDLSREQVARLDGASELDKGVPHGTISGSAERYSGGKTLEPNVIPVA
jgi:aryl-alcohol dehydrogenase-like predicted oxidoreductase